jgi:hypothetical protein
VNAEEKAALQRIAETTGKSVGDVVRQGLRVVLTATQGLGCESQQAGIERSP